MTIEVNPSKFLDTEIIIMNSIIETSLVVNESKIPYHWSSADPKKYKRNAILGELHRAKKFQVILNLTNRVLIKSILALISCIISFTVLLIFISKSTKP